MTGTEARIHPIGAEAPRDHDEALLLDELAGHAAGELDRREVCAGDVHGARTRARDQDTGRVHGGDGVAAQTQSVHRDAVEPVPRRRRRDVLALGLVECGAGIGGSIRGFGDVRLATEPVAPAEGHQGHDDEDDADGEGHPP
ncbi:hypothetical protein MN0502_18080 [Arthrobacter sp. MN05-02]|nr:hypothetical protein MN0502_18080 [Arthrobacter sp. MN05-02]